MTKGLNPEQIEKADDAELRKVSVPEWGGHVYVRSLTSGERDRFVSTCIDDKTGRMRTGASNVTAHLLAATVCDGDGNLVFTELSKGVAVFAEKSAAICGRLFDVATELNGLTEADVQDLAKNLPDAPRPSSHTDSAKPSAE